MNLSGLRIGLVGPLPPPSGGMANQTAQLAALLRAQGTMVELIQVNCPYRPQWLAAFTGIRAVFRLLPYLTALWQAGKRVDLFHVMANSGWSWYLYAAPAILVAKLKGKPVIVNYRGGEAEKFFERNKRLVAASLNQTDAIIVPSSFLAGVFEKFGFCTQIVPNIVDLTRFSPGLPRPVGAPLILVARNLEAIYDNASALRAFALVKQFFPAAQMCITGSGPELPNLERLAAMLGVCDAVRFAGRIENGAMAELYRSADIVLNPSVADNMPNSVLEALACGVPIVSTDVGGVPHLLQHDVTGWLVAPRAHDAMAAAIVALLRDPARIDRLRTAGLQLVQQFSWERVAPLLLAQYRRVLRRPRGRYSACVSRLLFPLQERIKGHTSVDLRQAMERSQWYSPQQLKALQLERLQVLLKHAHTHVPHYRRLFERIGFDPLHLYGLDALARLPLLTKADIRADCEAFKSDTAHHLARFNTGGSSGEPLLFYLSKKRVSHDVAAKWRATRWWGVDIGDRELVVWGSPIELQVQDRLRAWRDRLLRTSLWPAFQMSQDRLDNLLKRLRKMQPKMLFGYPSALSHIAQHATTRGVPLHDIGVQVAFVTAERLYDEQRARIGSVFGCPVANGYGGRDAGFIAHECPEGGMHITAEDVVVEVVDAQGQPVPDGQPGAIVVTHLASSDFPFIRYATGDVGVLDSARCPCGRGLPLLKQIEGRSTDFLVAQNGTVLHGLALIYILRELSQIQAFKIVQESVEQTRVLVVADSALGANTRDSIEAGFKDRLGQAVTIIIDEVQAIAPEASGKYRYVISKVAA